MIETQLRNNHKPTIKMNLCGCDEIKNKANVILNILRKHYNIEFSNTPDFVICGLGGNHFEYMKYDCVRILLMTENLSPDFTIFDYCIGFDYIDFGDRFFRLPFSFLDRHDIWIPELLSEEQARKCLESKKYFCNFIYRHPSSHGIREKIFDSLNNYKSVISAGNFRNNTSGEMVDYSYSGGKLKIDTNEKFEYLKKSKFTIAVESVVYPGFETEKIIHAFMNHSIPIYYGSNTILNTFNENAFVCVDQANLSEMVERVEYLDNHDDNYIEMLMECPLKNRMSIKNTFDELELFLINIISNKPILRRPQYYYVDVIENKLKSLCKDKEEKKVSFSTSVKRKIKNLMR